MVIDNNAPIVLTVAQDLIVKGSMHMNAYDQFNFLGKQISLTNVTIARLIDGEPYTVKYEHQIGDIVATKNGRLSRIVDKRDFSDPSTNSLQFVKDNPSTFTLVAKAEDVQKGVFN